MNFAEVVGQNHIKTTLQNEIDTGRIAHAYLFCGPRAVGKTTLARVFTKAINCLDRKPGQSEPCNKCQSCLDINAGRSLDIIEIDGASNTGVDNVRENIIASSRLSPSSSKFKVFIIDEVHMLSTAAFNALLKTMEEPPEYMVFILCTTEIHKVPATIISRCQRFDFKKISLGDAVKKLKYIAAKERVTVDDVVLESIARQSQGYMRDAESIFGQVISVAGTTDKAGNISVNSEEAELVVPRSDINEALELLNFLSRRDEANAIAQVNKLVNEGIDLRIFIPNFIELSRKIMLNLISQNLGDRFGLDFGDAMEKKAMELGSRLTVERLVEIIEMFSAILPDTKNAFIQQLPSEIAIVKLCQEAAVAPSAQSARPAAQPQSQPVPIKPAKSVGGDSKVDKEIVKQKWSELLAHVKQYNHSLSFILKVCQPQSVNGNEVCLAFKYKFHKDRIDEPQIKGMLEKAMAEIYGAALSVTAIIDENMAEEVIEANVKAGQVGQVEEKPEEPGGEKPSGDDMIGNLLNIFGGKVIN